MLKGIHRNVWWLAFAQACFIGVTMTVVSYGGLVGGKLAPFPALATFPIFCSIGMTALSTGFLSKYMGRTSRKRGFLLGSSIGLMGSLTAAYGIFIANFWLFCFGLMFMGVFAASSLYYRFAALECVEAEQGPKAVSIVLLGSLAGAAIVPFLTATMMDNFAPHIYMGAYLFAACAVMMSFLPISQIKTVGGVNKTTSDVQASQNMRSLKEIIKQPVFIAAVLNGATGYALMSFIMTASPIAMNMEGMGPHISMFVIQSHVIAMYLPSLFTGYLIGRFGVVKILFVGHAFFMIAFLTAIAGVTYNNFSVALMALGVGWNFCFIGSTSMLPRAYTLEEKPKTQGLNESIIYTSQATAIFITGWLLHYLGWTMLNQIAIGILLVTIFFTVRYALSKDRAHDH